MTNQHSQTAFDHAALRSAIAEYADGAARQGGYASEGLGPHLITRHGDETLWSLSIRVGTQSIRICTGTDDRRTARAIATAIQADAAAGRFTPKAVLTDARVLALQDAIRRSSQRPPSDTPSEAPARSGQPKVRKPGP